MAYKVKVLIIFSLIISVSIVWAEDRANRHFEKGKLLCSKGDYIAGILEYRDALLINPNHVATHNNLGIIYFQNSFLNDMFDELEDVKQDLTELNGYYDIINSLAIISRERQKVRKECPPCVKGVKKVLKDCVYHFERAKKIAPGLAQPWFNLGVIYLRQEKYKKALNNFLKVRNVYEKDSAYLYYLACAYAMLGKDDEAIHALSQAIEHGFQNGFLLEINSDFDDLRKNSKFKKLVSKISGKAI